MTLQAERPALVRRALFTLAVAAAWLPSPASARCLAYEPATVTLVGELTSRTVPGPPNYVSIARGDLPETIFVLRLAEPVCVSADPSSRQNSKSHAAVSEVQLSVPRERVRAFLGKPVRASGTLFGARSGHHRTPVLLRVSQLRGD